MSNTTPRRALAVAIGLATGAILSTTALSTPAGAVRHGPWSASQPVAPVNSPANEGCPIESPDGEHLFLMSTRGAGGDQDIWVASRDAVGSPFGAPVELPAPVNSGANDFCPTPLRGKGLLFVSNRGGTDAYGTPACGAGDMYFTRLSPASGRWSEPRNLGCVGAGGPNGPGSEFGPSLVETDAGTHLYFSSGGDMGSNTQDVYVSAQRPDGSFGPRSVVAALSTPGHDDAMPNIRKDGLEMVFTSNRPGGFGAFDIWTSSRARTSDPWGAPINLGPAINTAAPETRPSLSWRADRLYLGRAGEIHVSSR